MIGNELAFTPDIGLFEKIYIKIFGVPINGLRIRLRHILPVITGNYKKILDAVCGRAVFSFQLAKKFPRATVIGVDTDKKQLAVNRRIAHRAGLANVIFKPMDVASLAYREEFDLILSVDNLEHIEDDKKALQDMVGALKKMAGLYCMFLVMNGGGSFSNSRRILMCPVIFGRVILLMKLWKR